MEDTQRNEEPVMQCEAAEPASTEVAETEPEPSGDEPTPEEAGYGYGV